MKQMKEKEYIKLVDKLFDGIEKVKIPKSIIKMLDKALQQKDYDDLYVTAHIYADTEFLFSIDEMPIGIFNYNGKEYVVAFEIEELYFNVLGDSIVNWTKPLLNGFYPNEESEFRDSCLKLYNEKYEQFEEIEISYK